MDTFSGKEALVELARLITAHGVDQVEFRLEPWVEGVWRPASEVFSYFYADSVAQFRIKPQTCTLENYPRAESVMPAEGAKYWVPQADGSPQRFVWSNDNWDHQFLAAGSVYLDEQDAQGVCDLRKTAVKL